jgi:hypothetical protein
MKKNYSIKRSLNFVSIKLTKYFVHHPRHEDIQDLKLKSSAPSSPQGEPLELPMIP